MPLVAVLAVLAALAFLPWSAVPAPEPAASSPQREPEEINPKKILRRQQQLAAYREELLKNQQAIQKLEEELQRRPAGPSDLAELAAYREGVEIFTRLIRSGEESLSKLRTKPTTP
jgi:hypothetical protein